MARLAKRTDDLHASPVREMLKVAQQPGVISFAGGLPAPETFSGLDLPPPPRELLQYGPTEGEPELRARVAEDLGALGIDAAPERVLILSGSQQGVDLAAKLMVEAGAPIAVEVPAYLAALQVFRLFGARFVTLDRTDPNAAWTAAQPRLAYVTPTFQNPTGQAWSADQRQALARACDAHDVVLFEDDPYRDLAYAPCERRPACAFLERGSFIYQGSFSKTAAPGLRLGFLTASEDLFPYLARLKQAADLHTNRLSQWIVLQHLNAADRAERRERLVGFYRERRDFFDAALRRHLGGLAEWRTPPGGLFFWVELPGGQDVDALLRRATEKKVLFTPGRHFVTEETCSAMRLNFSLAAPAAAERGLEILGDLLREVA
jgi:DNA-binding transcriptional MocR family regulator